MKWLHPDSSCFKINVAGLSFKDGSGGVVAVIRYRAGEVFAALSERVCDSSLIKRMIVECEDTGMTMHLQM